MNSLYEQYRLRIKILASTIFLLGIVMLTKIFFIQIIYGEAWSEIADKQTLTLITKKGVRGNILDRNGIELAQTIKKFDFWVNTKKEFDKEKIITLFNHTLNIEELLLRKKLSKSKKYISIIRNIPENKANPILEKIKFIKGLNVDHNLKRYYPYRQLGAQLIGYVDQSNEGKVGIEYKFNDFLEGTTGKVVFDKSASGRLHKSMTAKQPTIKNGKNIQLTIDIEIQSILQNELEKYFKKVNAKTANGIIINPSNGEILAMATVPSFDPNSYSKFNVEYYKNRVIADLYEPGSTYKIVNIATALNNKYSLKNKTFFCENGKYKLPNGKIIHDHEPHGDLSISEIFAFSSNIGIMKIADILGDEAIYKASRNFGFGVSSGIELSGEVNGKLRTVDKWSALSGKEISIGQEIAVTTLQLANAFSVIANGGYLLKPKIIREQNRSNEKPTTPKVIRKVINEDVSKELLTFLETTVNKGTGKNAYIPGFRVGGKTGTAEKFINGSYSKHEFISSFAAIFPVDNPEYVCIVSVDAPSYGYHWGNETAAPIVKNVFSRIINDKDFLHAEGNYLLNDSSINEIDEHTITDNSQNKIPIKNQVPNFKGKTLKQAIIQARKSGIYINPIGTTGRVVWQSLPPGSLLTKNNICKVKLEVL